MQGRLPRMLRRVSWCQTNWLIVSSRTRYEALPERGPPACEVQVARRAAYVPRSVCTTRVSLHLGPLVSGTADDYVTGCGA